MRKQSLKVSLCQNLCRENDEHRALIQRPNQAYLPGKIPSCMATQTVVLFMQQLPVEWLCCHQQSKRNEWLANGLFRQAR